MAIIFTPTPAPGTTLIASLTAELPFNISISASDDTGTSTLTNIDLVLDSPYYDVTTTNGLTGTFSGTYHVDLFNHTADYVEKGQSDKTQTPVNVLIYNMPDYKEMFQVNVDATVFNTYGITVTATFNDPTTGLYTVVEHFTFDVYDDVPTVGAWIKDYFTNRY